MNRLETGKILTVLQAAYPNFYRGMKSNEVDDIINLWASMFVDEPYSLVSTAVKSLLATDSKGYPPHIGAVKAAIQSLTTVDTTTEAEAWAKVMKAASNSAYNSVEEFNKLPVLIQQVLGNSTALKEIALAEQGEELSVRQSNFMRSYREKALRARERGKLPNDIKRIVQGKSAKQIDGR